MEKITISVYNVLNTGENRYRILYIDENKVVGCMMDVTKLAIVYLPLEDIHHNLSDGKWFIEPEDNEKIIDSDQLSEKFRDKLLIYKSCMNDVSKVYGPTYLGLQGRAGKPEAEEIMKKYSILPPLFWKLCRRYLQSGCKDIALVDKRATGFAQTGREYHYKKRGGRPAKHTKTSSVIVDDQVKNYFDEALKAYKGGRQTTYKGAYEDMLHKHYMVQTNDGNVVSWDLLPEEQLPTYPQFYNYAVKKLSIEEKEAIRTSRAEQRNNKRLLLSDAMKGVRGPGDTVEVDALETDLFLVSTQDHEQTIGRGILYLMIDVWSRAIIAMSVGFENNSVLACTDLLLNLADDKVAYCERYGITFTKSLWPSNIIPRRMRVDRGADFRSDKLESILNGLGIDRMMAPAATGSMKGIVEQEFHQIKFNQNDIVEGSGLIEKRHDSQHHKEAKLTISEFTAMCINYVINHNQKYLQYYKMNKAMMDANVEPIPIKLWEYGCKKYGSPRPIADNSQFIWNLLTPDTAFLDRSGIRWKGLYYMNFQDKDLMHEMYKQGRKVKKIDVKYDPRDIGALYYMRNGRLIVAKLNPDKFGNEGFSGLTYKEYMEYLNTKKRMDASGKMHNTRVSISERTTNRQIVDSVQPVHYSDATDMREAREKERQAKNQNNAIINRLDDGNTEVVATASANGIASKKDAKPEYTFKPDQTDEEMLQDAQKAIEAFNDSQMKGE